MQGSRIRSSGLPTGVLIMLLACTPAQAALIQSFTDEAAFLGATGATAQPEIPDEGAKGTTATLGDLTLTTGSSGATEIFFGTGGNLRWSEWSTLLPGNDIAISGTEDLDIALSLGGSAFSAGFRFHEPTRPGAPPNTCNAPCVDSTFEVSVLDGGNAVGTVLFQPIQDQAEFFGVWTDTAFDELQITEITGGIDNEYFGRFFTGTRPVPLPGTFALLLIGLGGWAFAARRREAEPVR
jgi:hypothetical protein